MPITTIKINATMPINAPLHDIAKLITMTSIYMKPMILPKFLLLSQNVNIPGSSSYV